MVNESEIYSASILDKTDWRKSIHKYLDQCIYAEGTIHYPKAVEQLVSAVAAPFPNWDARKLINTELKRLKAEYKLEISKSIEKNPDYWVHPGKRLTIEPDVINSYYKDIFEFIKAILASKRMMLWGVKKTQGGTPLKD